MNSPRNPTQPCPPSCPADRALALATAWMVAGTNLAAAAEPPAWRVIEDHTPEFEARYEHAGAVFDGRLWIAGGLSIKAWHNDVWSSADGLAWREETRAAPWSPRAKAELVAFKDRLWLIGGLDDESTPEYLRNDVWTSIDGKAWELVTAAAPWEGRSDFAVEVFRDRLVVMGGHGRNGRLNDVWSSTDGKQWQCVAPSAPWSPRSEFAAVVHEGKLLVAGGVYFRSDLKNTSNKNGIYSSFPDVWASIDGANWICINEKAPFGGRYGSDMVSVGKHVLLMPGNEGADSADIDGYVWASDDGAGWFALSMPPQDQRFDRRVSQPFLFHNSSIWAPGGVYPFWGSIRFHHHTTVLGGDLAHPGRWRRDSNPAPEPLPGEPGFGPKR